MTDITWITEQRKLSNLAPWDKNPRKLSDHDAEQLRLSIERFGVADPLIVNVNGQLIGGHQRKKILAMMEMYGPDADVDVRVPSRVLTGSELAELNIRLNRNTGEWDWDLLASEFELDSLRDWGFTDFDFETAGWDNGKEPPPDPGPQVDKAAELQEKWETCLGQLWELGDHRLLCGDCTDGDVVENVMRGEKAGAVVTDPPYGVTDEPWDRYPTNDDLALWLDVSEGAVIAFGGAHPKAMTALLALEPQAERIYVWWNTFTRTSSEGAFWQWQPIYVWRRTFVRGLEKDVIAMAAVTGGDKHMHVTQKPVPLMEMLIIACQDATVFFEPFCGSGTTLAACERLSRRCRAIEIEPKYVAVTLQRWHDMTEHDPILVEG